MNIIQAGKELYRIEEYDLKPVSNHEGGRNRSWVCSEKGEKRFILRVSELEDRTEQDYPWIPRFLCISRNKPHLILNDSLDSALSA